MSVTYRSTNNIPKLKRLLNKLGGKEIQVGIFGEDSVGDSEEVDLVTLARVHEYGMTIRPRRAKWLTMPLIREAKGKKASDFSGLFMIKKDDDRAVLARSVGRGRRARVQAVFLLVKSVSIPERSFLRSGFDENVDKIVRKMESMIDDVVSSRISPDVFLDMIGMEFAGLIQKKMRRVEPANAPVTKRVKGSSGTLRDTGRLIGAVRHKVVE